MKHHKRGRNLEHFIKAVTGHFKTSHSGSIQNPPP
jgi:hypothetical protein